MILPQVGVSGLMPAPRNDRIASVRTADAQTYVPCTIRGAIVFGIKCRHMIFGRLEPTEIAASTYGSSRADSTTERTSRATIGICGMMMATSTVIRLAPDSETTAMASRMLGIAINPFEEAGHEADHKPDANADDGCSNADQQRDPSAIENSRQHVAAIAVGAEQKLRACRFQPLRRREQQRIVRRQPGRQDRGGNHQRKTDRGGRDDRR